MKLPGICKGCRQPVFWTGRVWRNPTQRRGRHRCRADGVTRCGLWMPQAKERCARFAGHSDHCSTRYAMDNATRARRRWDWVAA